MKSRILPKKPTNTGKQVAVHRYTVGATSSPGIQPLETIQQTPVPRQTLTGRRVPGGTKWNVNICMDSQQETDPITQALHLSLQVSPALFEHA